MLRLRYLALAFPLTMQMSGAAPGALASEDEDKPQVITITTVDVDTDSEKKAAEEKIRAAKSDFESRAKKVRAEADKARAEAEKARTAAKAKAAAVLEPHAPAQVLTIVTSGDDSKDDGEHKDEKRVTLRGQFKITSPDGKTFEVVGPEEVRLLHEKLHGKFPPGNRVYTTIRTKDGEETKLETDDINKLLGELTARVKDGGEAPKFIIGVSVSEAPAVVLSQIGRPDDSAVVVDSVVDDSPAAKAGIKKLDLILKAAGEPVKSPGELTKAVKAADGKEIELVLVRTGKELTVHVTPKSNEPASPRVKVVDGTIQFGPGMVLNRPGMPPGPMAMGFGMPPGNLMEEIKSLRKDIEELKKMIEELKAAK